MTMTREETLAYQRGYNRARTRAFERVAAVIKIAKRIRDRQNSTAANLCQNCDRWTRGGPSCVWGHCRGDFEWGIEPRMWPDTYPNQVKATITTDENFGCVSWLPHPR